MAKLTIKARHEWSPGRAKTTIDIKGASRFEPNQIYYDISGPDAPDQEPNGNFAIAAALPTAMKRGQPLHFQGEVDSDFLATIEEYMAAWCRWRPDLFRPVAITADSEAPPRLPLTRRSIMAFSGGVDSTFALHAHKHNLLGRRGLDIQAAALIQGFDLSLDDQKSFDSARGHVKSILESYGLDLNVVRTNWRKPFAVKWGMTHVLGIAAILLQFHRRFGFGVFAADNSYDNQSTPWSNNEITNQMLGSTSFSIRSTGAAWHRTEKAAIIAENPAVLDHIRVCFEHPESGHNCGGCEKCIRTKLNFYANGWNSVPALGQPVTIDDVRRISIPRGGIANEYIDLLTKGSWRIGDPVRAEVVELIERYNAQEGQAKERSVKHRRPVLRRIQKRLVKPLVRALGGLFN